MNTWIDAQAKLAQAERMLTGAAKLTREAAEIMERVNERAKADSERESIHDASGHAGVYRVP